jgi:3-oxoacyl-[acyl-carrier-protein] synthase-1
MSAVVVRVGAVTALGLDARRTGFLLRAGFPAMAESPLSNGAGEAVTMAFLPTIDPALVGPERLAALALPAFAEAVAPLGDLPAEVLLAVDEGLPHGALAAPLLETALLRAMPRARLTVEPRGEAALGSFLPKALAALRARSADLVVVGGVHSDYDPEALTRLEASGRLFSRDNLDARIPGEAAAFAVLMRDGDASRQGLPALARVLGVGTGRERARPDNEDPAFAATGMTAAVRAATAPLAAGGAKLRWLLTDLTGEMRRLYEWQAVFTRTQDLLEQPCHVDSPAQRIGYLGAAALPLSVAMAATAWEHGYAPAPVALATAGSDGGERAAIVLGRA